MNSITNNRLDREGFKILFDFHAESVKSKLIQLFEDIQKQNRSAESASDTDLVVKQAKKIIHESRAKLDIFHVDGIPDINEFLESNLPSEKLDMLIREAVRIVLSSSGDSAELRKRAIQYIKHTQIGLLKEINTRIIDIL